MVSKITAILAAAVVWRLRVLLRAQTVYAPLPQLLLQPGYEKSALRARKRPAV